MLKKRLGKKGFTLVEVIVVLVILAILAAILIPSMVGWIEKANDRSAVIAGRTALLAAQTIASENYPIDQATLNGKLTEIEALAGVEGLKVTGVTLSTTTDGTVESVTYEYNSKSYTFASGTGLTTNP
ncbi:MAG: prepilin-type N-terminal cleavage/methylation domain-containing protein [Clostridia bacterium]|nr:prepilin-type N-terminal cleavage/methylation domain-containing protein [Clostridia bacterium]